MNRPSFLLLTFTASLIYNLVYALRAPHWLTIPALLVGWYLADFMSGVVHMYMDYRPCPRGRGLNQIYFYAGSRESAEYLDLLKTTMASIGPFERLSYDFKNHHPRPDALGRRPLWRLIGTTVIIAALPLSLCLNAAAVLSLAPHWFMAGAVSFLIGGAFAQYFHGSLHRLDNPLFIRVLRKAGLLMSPAAHQIHHDTLQRDFATNCGWSNPVINRVFMTLRGQGMLKDAGLTPAE